MFRHFGPVFVFRTPDNLENQNFEKLKKILHMPTLNDNQMMHDS